jgi:hypothetical protein
MWRGMEELLYSDKMCRYFFKNVFFILLQSAICNKQCIRSPEYFQCLRPCTLCQVNPVPPIYNQQPVAGKPDNLHIKSQKPKKSRLSFTHVIPSVTVRPFSLSRVVFLHDLWQSGPILGTNGINNHCFTGWCGGWYHHG